MKKIFLLLTLFSSLAFGADHLLYAPSGNMILDAKTGYVVKVSKTLQVDKIVNLAGTSGAPGMVPIGGMVAVMPNTHASAWQPPVSGAIKDGFMRADGSVVPTCSDCTIPAGTTLPNMTTRYVKGSTTSGTTGGANLQASNVTVGNHTALSLSNHATLSLSNHATLSLSNHAAHKHATGYLNAAGNGSWSAFNSAEGLISITNGINACSSCGGGFSPAVISTGSGTQYTYTDSLGALGHTFAQNIDGHTFAQNIDGHTFAQNIDIHAVTNNTVNNEPAYTEVVWVIRVK
jgi:hypothetical protein